MNAIHTCRRWHILEYGQLREGAYRIERCKDCGQERALVNGKPIVDWMIHVFSHQQPQRVQ